MVIIGDILFKIDLILRSLAPIPNATISLRIASTDPNPNPPSNKPLNVENAVTRA